MFETLVFFDKSSRSIFSPRLIEPYRDPTRLQNWSVFYCFFLFLPLLGVFFLYQFGARNKCLLVVAFKISLSVLYISLLCLRAFYTYIHYVSTWYFTNVGVCLCGMIHFPESVFLFSNKTFYSYIFILILIVYSIFFTHNPTKPGLEKEK